MQSLAVGHVSTASYGKPRITNQVKSILLSFAYHLYICTIQLIACPLTVVSMHVTHTVPQGQNPWVVIEQGLG